MGQSTDAYLFYGLCWSEEGAELFGEDIDDGEWTELVLARRGIEDPWKKIPPDLNMYDRSSDLYSSYEEQQRLSNEWVAEHRSEIDAWHAAKKAVEDEYGVEISSHCSCDYPMPYIHVKNTKFQAWRGTPRSIDIQELAQFDTDAANEELQRFVEDLDIDISEAEGPGWFLVSNWC